MPLDTTLELTREVDGPSDAVLAAGRATTLAQLDDALSFRAAVIRRRTRRRLTWGAAVASVAAAALVLTQTGGAPEREPLTKPPVVEREFTTASQVLKAAAAASASYPDLGDAPYWKVVYGQGETKDEMWVGIDGPGVGTLRGGPGEVYYSEVPQAVIEIDGQPFTWREINDGALTKDQLAELITGSDQGAPDKPDRPAKEYYLFKNAAELLGMTPASPEIRTELWNALSQVAGVQNLGKQEDSAGRTGWAVALTTPGQGTQTFIVDPDTGALLESRTETEVEHIVGYTTIFEYGPAGSAPEPNDHLAPVG